MSAYCWCCLCPEQETVAVVERFGKFKNIAEAGFHCLNPCFGERSAGRLSLRVQQLDVRCETKTKDNVFVTLHIAVQFKVLREAAFDAYYRLTYPAQQISSYVYDVVRSGVPRMDLDAVFENKEEIAMRVQEEVSKAMTGYGYLIIHTLVTDIEPAHKVKEAMNEINAARRQRLATLEKAEANKVTLVKAAEAEAESKFLQGQGMARQRQAIIAGLRDSVRDFSDGVEDISPKEVLELMLMTQYFDMLRDIGSSGRSSTLFLPHSPSGMADVGSQIRDAILQGSVIPKQQQP